MEHVIRRFYSYLCNTFLKYEYVFNLIALDSFRCGSRYLGSEVPFNVNQTVKYYLELVLAAT